MSNISPVSGFTALIEPAALRSAHRTGASASPIDVVAARPTPLAAVPLSVAAEQASPRPVAQLGGQTASLNHPRALARYAAAAALRTAAPGTAESALSLVSDLMNIVSPLALPT